MYGYSNSKNHKLVVKRARHRNTFLLLFRPQNIALHCIYIRLHKYSIEIPIITIALEL